jgi:multidrug transporter EmrE-like cation transporter
MSLEIPVPEAAPVVAQARQGIAASIALLIVSVSFAVAGQLTLKSAMTEVGRIGASEVRSAGHTVARALREPRLWIGLGLFGVSSLFWLVVLSRVPLSLAYPFVGISYVVVVGFSALVLHEHVPLLRWLGVTVIVAGIILVGLSFARPPGR